MGIRESYVHRLYCSLIVTAGSTKSERCFRWSICLISATITGSLLGYSKSKQLPDRAPESEQALHASFKSILCPDSCPTRWATLAINTLAKSLTFSNFANHTYDSLILTVSYDALNMSFIVGCNLHRRYVQIKELC